MTENLQIRVFVEDSDGLQDYSDPSIDAFGGMLPQVGDEIGLHDRWIGNSSSVSGNSMLLVKRRVFVRDYGVALICEVRACALADRELFP